MDFILGAIVGLHCRHSSDVSFSVPFGLGFLREM